MRVDETDEFTTCVARCTQDRYRYRHEQVTIRIAA